MPIKRTGPRAGSRAYRALQALHEAGPLVTPAWITRAEFFESPSSFHTNVVEPLLRAGLIVQERLYYVATAAGRKYLGVDVEPSVPGIVTPGRFVPLQRPLSPKNRPAQRAMRPGAFDYRDIPSVHAGRQVAFRSSITVHQEDNAA